MGHKVHDSRDSKQGGIEMNKTLFSFLLNSLLAIGAVIAVVWIMIFMLLAPTEFGLLHLQGLQAILAGSLYAAFVPWVRLFTSCSTKLVHYASIILAPWIVYLAWHELSARNEVHPFQLEAYLILPPVVIFLVLRHMTKGGKNIPIAKPVVS